MRRILTETQRLLCIAEILERVDGRCMAADGPVTQTKEEIEGAELREIYLLATGARSKPKQYPYNATMGVNFGKVSNRRQRAGTE